MKKLICVIFISNLIFTSCSKTTPVTQTTNTGSPNSSNPISSKVPIGPSDIKLTVNFINSYTISWTDLSNDETGFKIERSINNSDFSVLATLPANSTNFIDSNLNPNSILRYRVCSYNNVGNSVYTSTLSTTTPAFPVIQANIVAKFTDISLIISGKITNTGGVSLVNLGYPNTYGVIWNTSPIDIKNPFANTSSWSFVGGVVAPGLTKLGIDSTLTSNIYNLQASTKYYIRFFVNNGNALNFSNEINVTTKQSPSIKIGQNYQGGIIAYYLQPIDSLYDQNISHGIIIAPIDQSTGIAWGPNTSTGATSSLIGDGKTNQAKIMKLSSPSSYQAAYLCDTLTLGGYTDWVLPSSGEFQAIATATNSNTIANQVIFLKNQFYWTSTENTAIITGGAQQDALYIDFTSGSLVKNQRKSYKNYVRAIRYF